MHKDTHVLSYPPSANGYRQMTPYFILPLVSARALEALAGTTPFVIASRLQKVVRRDTLFAPLAPGIVPAAAQAAETASCRPPLLAGDEYIYICCGTVLSILGA